MPGDHDLDADSVVMHKFLGMASEAELVDLNRFIRKSRIFWA